MFLHITDCQSVCFIVLLKEEKLETCSAVLPTTEVSQERNVSIQTHEALEHH